ncbi:hypothetical protein AXF42_Ash000685 [Apostasia shenzhenica]|uniref:Uncharacterized protein n=1 Tax=Apostasia shenzhenica TaxID=1088818 RepID=A0A2I0AH44_9ASPA|nr:hypothetical protein AXF42_Ash000685 [Apostasia shenzhenica]
MHVHRLPALRVRMFDRLSCALVQVGVSPVCTRWLATCSSTFAGRHNSDVAMMKSGAIEVKVEPSFTETESSCYIAFNNCSLHISGRIQVWGSTSIFYPVFVQLAAAAFAYIDVHRHVPLMHWDSCWLNFFLAIENIGSHIRTGCCVLLPIIQLVLGMSNPSWLSLPYFICSCIGLVNWSLTSNFLGLFCWWRSLRVYACFNVLLLYIYQLPFDFPKVILEMADFIGLYKITTTSGRQEALSACSLLLFYCTLSMVKFDLEEMDFILSMQDNSVTEQLLPSNDFFTQEFRLVKLCSSDFYLLEPNLFNQGSKLALNFSGETEQVAMMGNNDHGQNEVGNGSANSGEPQGIRWLVGVTPFPPLYPVPSDLAMFNGLGSDN